MVAEDHTLSESFLNTNPCDSGPFNALDYLLGQPSNHQVVYEMQSLTSSSSPSSEVTKVHHGQSEDTSVQEMASNQCQPVSSGAVNCHRKLDFLQTSDGQQKQHDTMSHRGRNGFIDELLAISGITAQEPNDSDLDRFLNWSGETAIRTSSISTNPSTSVKPSANFELSASSSQQEPPVSIEPVHQPGKKRQTTDTDHDLQQQSHVSVEPVPKLVMTKQTKDSNQTCKHRNRKPLKEIHTEPIDLMDEVELPNDHRLRHNRSSKRRYDRICRLYQKIQDILQISPSHSHIQVLELSATELKARGQLIDSLTKRESLAAEQSVLLKALLQAKEQEITHLQQRISHLEQAAPSSDQRLESKNFLKLTHSSYSSSFLGDRN